MDRYLCLIVTYKIFIITYKFLPLALSNTKLLHPESQSTKKRIWPTDEVINDESYDVIAVNTASKCLARMTGCWDPKLEPTVKEIVDYQWYIMAILSVRSLWQARTLRGFPYPVQHMAGGGQKAQAACPKIRVHEFVNVSWFELWRRTVAWCTSFHEGRRGMQSKLFVWSRYSFYRKSWIFHV